MKLNVGEIRGLLANSYNITVPSETSISFEKFFKFVKNNENNWKN